MARLRRRRRANRELLRAYGARVRPLGRVILDLLLRDSTCSCAGQGCLVCRGMAHLVRNDDPIAYRRLVTGALCAVGTTAPTPPRYSRGSFMKQGELVGYVTNWIHRSTNVLRNGDLVTSSSWATLLSRIGELPMWYILDQASIFLPVKKRSFIQVTGVPIDTALSKRLPKRDKHSDGFKCPLQIAQEKCPNCYPWRVVDAFNDLTGYFPPKQTDVLQNPATCVADTKTPRKRKRNKRKQANDQTHALGPIPSSSIRHSGAICFNCLMLDASKCVSVDSLVGRSAIFYDTGISKNVFRRNNLLNKRKRTDARSLIKHVFGIKECCFKFFHCKCERSSTNCRYPELLQQVKNLMRNSTRCQYQTLFERHCPAKKKVAEDGAKNELEAYSTHQQVVSFVWAVLTRIIRRKNMKNHMNELDPLLGPLRKNIWKFVTLRRYETFQVADCIGGLKVSDYSWLLEIGSTGCSCCEPIRKAAVKSSVIKEQKQNNLLCCWISWLFNGIVIPLINTYFYVTERETKGYDVFYYPKSVWRNITSSAISSLKAKNKRRFDATGTSRRPLKQLYRHRPSTVRFLPNAEDVRPLVGFKAQSKDAALGRCHLVIKKVTDENPEMFGSSVFDYDSIHKNFSSFISSVRGQLKELKIYIVVANVSEAFDCVKHEKLLEIMDEVLKGDEYDLRKCKKVVYNSSKNQVYRFDSNVSVSKGNNIQDLSFQPSSSGRILVDQGTVSTIQKEELRLVLDEQVKDNILKFGQDFCLKTVGIAQGNKLSSQLCSLYYGHLENSLLLKFLEDEKIKSADYLLMRFTGDFVFISSSKKHALNFLNRIRRGFVYYNSYMDERKYGLNFKVEGIQFEHNRVYTGDDGVLFMPWSGLLINCEDLEIQADYTRYLGIAIKSMITVKTHRNCSMEELGSKLCYYMSPNCHPIFYDSNINSPGTVRLNLYQAFLLCAMKFHCYIKSCGYPSSISKPAELLHTVKKTCWHTHGLIFTRVKDAQLQSSVPPVLELTHQETMWLGLSAFICVLQKKQTRHRDLLALLRAEVRACGHIDSDSDSLHYAVAASHSSVFWKLKY